jgi:hypothetical protein
VETGTAAQNNSGNIESLRTLSRLLKNFLEKQCWKKRIQKIREEQKKIKTRYMYVRTV